MSSGTNAAQAADWNDESGPHWVEFQASYDAMLAPFLEAVLGAAAPSVGERVLDIGCGCGATTRAVAGAVTPGGEAVGYDLSVPMTDLARRLAADEGVPASFVVGDVQVEPLGEATFDLALSRFGVMFFDDPVAAFANVGAALRPGGRLVFTCWRGLPENPWMLVPIGALAEVGLVAPAPPAGPGPFAFADPDLVRSVLGAAGFEQIELEPVDASLLLGGGADLAGTVAFVLTTSGPRRLLAGAPAEQAEAAAASLARALAPRVGGDGVRLDGATWLVTARWPG